MFIITPACLSIGAVSVVIDIFRNVTLPRWFPQLRNATSTPTTQNFWRFYDSEVRYWFYFFGIVGVSRLVGDLLLNSSFLSNSAASLSLQIVVLSVVNGVLGFADAIYVASVDPDQRGMGAAFAGLLCFAVPPAITITSGILVPLTGFFSQEQNFSGILSLSQFLCPMAVSFLLLIGKLPREEY